MKSIERLPLREQIHRRLIKSLIAGEFPPGSKVKDTEIAEMLGISRTPAREALLRLEQDGFLKNLVGRGFVVQPLDPREPEEIYPLIIELECMALKAAPPWTPGAIAKLRQLGATIAAPDTPPLRRLELDVQWHGLLIEPCGNSHLLRVVSQLKQLVQRYLHAYILTCPDIRPSVDHHGQILDRLEAGETDTATDILTEHWLRNLGILRRMIGDQQP